MTLFRVPSHQADGEAISETDIETWEVVLIGTQVDRDSASHRRA